MFGPRIQQYARHIAEMVVRPFAAIGLTPNMATVIGLLLNAVVAAVLATGHLRAGGVLLVVAGLFDMIDGALARVRNQKTVFGAFFDSTLDRYSEGIVLLGIILFALNQRFSANLAWERPWVVILAYVAGLGSLMVSYARARAEGLGLEMKTGLMARPERVMVLAAGLILGAENWLVWTLLVLAVTSVYTSIQRILGVYLALARRGAISMPESAKAHNMHSNNQPDVQLGQDARNGAANHASRSPESTRGTRRSEATRHSISEEHTTNR